MNEIAAKLIHDLRYDAFTRQHFDIEVWGSSNCGSVGCIAGTAVLMACGVPEQRGPVFLTANKRLCNIVGKRFTEDGYPSFDNMIIKGAEVLGITEVRTAHDLFVPWDHASKLRCAHSGAFDYLPTQARPSLETVEQMVRWAEDLSSDNPHNITPDRAAYALERIVRDEVPYCNWAEAFEKA